MPGNAAVALQLEIRVKVPKSAELTRDLLDAVVRRWAIDGYEPRGMRIRIVDWRHQGKRSGSPASQREARMRFRGLLQEGRFTVNLRGD